MTTARARARAQVPVDAELKTLGAWLKRFISREAVERLEQAHSNATVGLFRHAMSVLDTLGFRDGIMAVCDRTEVFADAQRRTDDLGALTEAVLESEPLYAPFSELRIVAARDDERTARLAVVRIEPGPPGDPPQLRIDVAARDLELRARHGETVTEFASRVRAWADDGERVGALIRETHEIATRFAAELGAALTSVHASTTDGRLEIIALDATDAGRLRHLGFGEFVRSTSYRAAPSYTRSAPNDGPFDYYLYDPYDALARQLLLDAMRRGALVRRDVLVIDSDATVLGAAHQLPEGALAGLAVGPDAVRIEEDELVVDSSIPAVSALDPAEATSEHAPGYGGGGG